MISHCYAFGGEGPFGGHPTPLGWGSTLHGHLAGHSGVLAAYLFLTPCKDGNIIARDPLNPLGTVLADQTSVRAGWRLVHILQGCRKYTPVVQSTVPPAWCPGTEHAGPPNPPAIGTAFAPSPVHYHYRPIHRGAHCLDIPVHFLVRPTISPP